MSKRRAVIADDALLFRDAIANLLRQNDVEVLAELGDAVSARQAVAEHRPDIAIMDIRMPPGGDVDGLQAAIRIRQDQPDVAVLLLSGHVEYSFASALLGDNARGVGYLLKDRVAGARSFVNSVRDVAAGGCVVDPEVVAPLLRPTDRSPLADLTEREVEVLALMAEGRSNQAIGAALSLQPKTVETHIRNIFMTLNLAPEPTDHRRVLAVLAYLRSQ